MPVRPGKACRVLSCPSIVVNGKYQGFCENHKDRSGWFRGEKERGNRHKRGYGSVWERQRKIILDRDEHICQACNREGRVTTANIVDHIIPKSQGGTNNKDNLEAICSRHHTSKTQQEARVNANQY